MSGAALFKQYARDCETSGRAMAPSPEDAAAESADVHDSAEPRALGQVSVVVGPIKVRDISKAEELLAALRAVRDGALSEGRVSEYDVYVTNSDCEVRNDRSNSLPKPAGPYYLREIYPSKAAQDAHGKESEALAAFRTAKGVLADFKDPDCAVDITRAAVTEGEVISEAAFLARVNESAASDQAVEALDLSSSIFGAQPDLDTRVLPAVQAALRCLERAAGEEGIWRKAGNKSTIIALVQATRGCFPLEEAGNQCHVVTGMLVRFLQAIPGGLIPDETVRKLVDSGASTESEVATLLQHNLSEAHWLLLSAFVEQWRLVTLAEDSSRMDAKNMATCVFMALNLAEMPELKLRDAIKLLVQHPVYKVCSAQVSPFVNLS